MNLTSAQLTSLKNAIAANTTVVTSAIDLGGAYIGLPLNQIPSTVNPTIEGAQTVANFYNLAAAGPFLVFNTAVPMSAIMNQILFANFTPVDAITSANAAQWSACSLSCQGKQFNLELMGLLNPTNVFDASLVNLRKGLKDATSTLPSGASFVNQDGGWNATLGTAPGPLTRSATNFEVLFAVASTGPLAAGTGALGAGGAQGVANVSVPAADSTGAYLQGTLTYQDILRTWGFNV